MLLFHEWASFYSGVICLLPCHSGQGWEEQGPVAPLGPSSGLHIVMMTVTRASATRLNLQR